MVTIKAISDRKSFTCSVLENSSCPLVLWPL